MVNLVGCFAESQLGQEGSKHERAVWSSGAPEILWRRQRRELRRHAPRLRRLKKRLRGLKKRGIGTRRMITRQAEQRFALRSSFYPFGSGLDPWALAVTRVLERSCEAAKLITDAMVA